MSLLPTPLKSLHRRYLKRRTQSSAGAVLLWWGSYGYGGGPTAGDLLAVDNLSAELRRRGFAHDVLSHPELGVSGHLAVPDIFALTGPLDVVAFVCGPLTDHRALRDFLHIHSAARKVAAGVSILSNHAAMTGRFDVVVARDGTDDDAFDLAAVEVAAPANPLLPPGAVAGTSFRGRQTEYGAGRLSLWEQSEAALLGLAQRKGLETRLIDTKLRPDNRADAIDRAFSDADLVLTTRLHGALLGLSKGKPVIAIDQVPGTAKLTAVMQQIGWKQTFAAETVTAADIDAAHAALGGPSAREMVAAAQTEIAGRTRRAIERAADAIMGISTPTAAR